MHGGGSWGPPGKKADTWLSGRASELQGGQMASLEKEWDGEGRVDDDLNGCVCGCGVFLAEQQDTLNNTTVGGSGKSKVKKITN